MSIVIITLSILFGIPALFALVIYLEDNGTISRKVAWLIIIGLCLMPYIVSIFFLKEDFLIFWIAYTLMMLIALAIVGIIKLFQR